MPRDDQTDAPLAAKPAGETVHDFRLQFTIGAGDPCGDGLYQWTTVLNACGGASPRASMLLTRHNGDLIGRPVGLFSDSLAPAVARRMAARLDEISFTALPKPTKGDVNSSTLGLKYQNGSHSFSRNFNAQNHDFLAAIAPVMEDLRPLMSQLLATPERALAVSVETGPDAKEGLRFRLRLTNVGTNDVLVADPRIVTRGSQPKALLQLAPVPVRVPGQMEIPPRWRPLPLEPAPASVSEAGLTIKAKQSLAILSALWNAPAPGEYMAQAVWQDYSGPAKIDAQNIQPAIPVTADRNPKPMVMRGAAFSSYLRFVRT